MPRKPAKPKTVLSAANFAALVEAIANVHLRTQGAAAKAVNVALTSRNWLIGAYIHEYELKGLDRADYGERLFELLARRLKEIGIPNCNRSRLYRYRDFYRLYPQILAALPQSQTELIQDLPSDPNIVATASPQSTVPSVATLSPLSGKLILNRLSYSHIELLLEIDDPLKRAFYEIECIRGNWSVRALKRQIATLYYERAGFSDDKEKVAARAHAVAEQAEPKLAIHDPYVFEFLGLRPKDAASESRLEDALLDKLQDFLLELGNGFCFEARQKSIVIGKTRGFVDLVFYHRILKCHVLIELKVDEFRHEHLGQLNTYVTWFRGHMMAEGDSPPVGLLLCTQKDHALVEYALAGIDNRLFVSKYQLELPKREDLQRFLEDKRREMADIE
jgi:predicted nuclease of restriction endonuclease-like (RecB) superfamily